MKNRLYLIAGFIILVLHSCKSDKAMQFSNTIVQKYKALLPEAQHTDEMIKSYMENDNYDSIAIVAEKMETLADEKLREVKALTVPNVNNANTFKQSVVDYFTYIKSIYTGYKDMGLAKPGRDRQNAAQIVQLIVSNKDSVTAQMQRIQKAFADSNGFRIE